MYIYAIPKNKEKKGRKKEREKGIKRTGMLKFLKTGARVTTPTSPEHLVYNLTCKCPRYLQASTLLKLQLSKQCIQMRQFFDIQLAKIRSIIRIVSQSVRVANNA